MGQNAFQRRELRRALDAAGKPIERRRGNQSDLHRAVEWTRDIAPDVIGGLILFPIAIALVLSLCVFVQAAGLAP